MRRAYKHILFDFDGTLVDSAAVVGKAVNELALKYGFGEIKPEEFNLFQQRSLQESLKALNIPLYRLLFLGKAVADFKKLYRQRVKELVFYGDMKRILNLLRKKGYVLSIVTSNSAAAVEEFLHMHRFDGFREVRSAKGLYGKHQTINRYLIRNRLKREEVLYIGDERRDIDACKKSGIDMMAVAWGRDSMDDLLADRPKYAVVKPSDITKHL
ncbi:HAD-IA family hydrolase [Gorillibacterium massiliense]|uniref:HAD-IA family hydrolase n=1 Tax=Gorillibacterium massiliense TaxID=1280390 RepID=UPI000592F7E1|nr:HAD-IA family hydrolase [Gorillibacterium massiliense]